MIEVEQDRYDNNGVGDPSSTDQPKARVYYTVDYYDAINRLIADVDVGTHGGTAYTRPSDVPARSDEALVTSYTYNDAGWVDTVTDPKGIVTKTLYDNLGQTLYTIAAWDGSYDPTTGALPPSEDADQTTEYTYDGNGDVTAMTALMPSGEDSQTTQYLYGVSTDDGSTINSNDLLRLVEYPDPVTGEASVSSSGQNSYTYDALGHVLTSTDQNGTVHTYSYDVLGRQTLDSVTTLGAGVDGAVRSIGTTYNTQGLVDTITSYSTTTADPDHIVNQTKDLYNGFGQLTQEYQSTSGAVDTETTPSVQYGYGTPGEGSRLASMTYPNGTVLTYSYGTSGSLNDTISRLDALVEGNQTLESYQYLGLSTVVVREQPQAGIELTYIEQSGDADANTDAGDEYTGLDRFGRVIDQNWINTTDGTTLDRYQYSYDRDGNVTAKANLLNSALDETYTYDNLSQLTATYRDGSIYQSWTLDALGNMQSVTTDGTTTDNVTNDQNELTSQGDATLSYDNNGNTLTDDQGHTLVYDAWNRLVSVSNDGTVLASYSYDGSGRRVTETDSTGTTTDLYYSALWQVIEERQGGQTVAQELWSPVYVNALVLKDSNTTGNPAEDGLNQRVYALQDANYNVTALFTMPGVPYTWQVVQRYVYDSYGNVQTLNASWSSTTDAYHWNYLFQGGRYNAVTGLYHFDARDYSPTMMRWVQQDPMGYIDGPSRYQFVRLNPNSFVDPTGTQEVPPEEPTGGGEDGEGGGGGEGTGSGLPLPPPGYHWQEGPPQMGRPGETPPPPSELVPDNPSNPDTPPIPPNPPLNIPPQPDWDKINPFDPSTFPPEWHGKFPTFQPPERKPPCPNAEKPGAPEPPDLQRPYIRKPVRQAVGDAAPRTPDGRPIDPNTRKPIDGKPDLGHKPGNEFWREKAQAEAEGLTQKEFNDRMNDPNKYQLEDPSSNRSHRYEQH